MNYKIRENNYTSDFVLHILVVWKIFFQIIL